VKTTWERWKSRLERRSDGTWFNPEGVDDESFFQSLEEVRQESGATPTFSEGIDEDEWLRAAARNPAFRDLEAPEEDVYSLDDGDPFLDQI
jgi:hypothetical protein